MNTRHSVLRPSRLLPAVLLLSALAANAQVRDLYLVAHKKAELFLDRRLQTLHLQLGDVVEGQAHATYRDWLRIVADGKPYDSRAKYFTSRASIREEFARTQADLVSRIERYTARIDSAREQLYQYHSAIAAIRFDSTVEYRVRKVVPVAPRTREHTDRRTEEPTSPATTEAPRVLPPGVTRRLPTAVPRATRGRLPAAVPGTIRRITPVDPERSRERGRHPSGPTQETPRVRVTYSYNDKVSPSRAKTQAKRWRGEAEKLEKSIRQCQEKRRQDLALLAASQSKAQAVERHFRAYLANRRSQALRPYLVIAEKTGLLDGNKTVAQLQREQIVLGRPNHRFSRWLRVQMSKGMLDGRAEHFASREALEADGAARVTQLTRLVADLQEEIADLAEREKLLRTLRLSLQYKGRVAQIPLTVYPFPAHYAGRTLYWGGGNPRDAVEMINGSRARSVRRDWERELKTLSSRLTKGRRRLETARRNLAVTKARAEERGRRLRQADPAERATIPGAILP